MAINEPDLTRSAFYNRVGHVEILMDGFVKEYRECDFKFNVRKNCIGACVDTAKIGILGLNRDTVGALSTYMDVATNINMRRYIKVYAGYELTGEQLIFAGDIMFAKPSQPVDNWLNIEAQIGAWLRFETRSVSSGNGEDGQTVGILIQNIAKAMRLRVDTRSISKEELNSPVSSFDCSGNWLDIIRRLNATMNVKVLLPCDDDGNMYMKVVPDDITKIHGEKNFKIDEASGLIGVPEYSWPYVKFTMLINPAVKMFDTISIKSNLVPHASGHEYQITDITYNGQMRGQSWYMTCSARDVSAKKIRRKA